MGQVARGWIMMIAVWVFSGVVFFVLAKEVYMSEPIALDQSVVAFMAVLQQPGILSAMVILTETGSVWWFTFFSLLVAGALWRLQRSQWSILYFLFVIGGGGLLNLVLKFFFERERPNILLGYEASGYSFPSGHAMGSLVFYGFIYYLVQKSEITRGLKVLLSFLLLTIILIIGFSRMYLGVHYLTDVIAGYMAGLVWLTLCLAVLEYTDREKWRKI